MITKAEVQKLRAVRAPGPSVLSVYVWVPVDSASSAGLARPGR